ncbi:MAG TPA: serine/threonine-protein kinase [Polyangiaceae bacterium]|nr:serine/threonine-protein kinase [Polyangiaceae bacterium]
MGRYRLESLLRRGGMGSVWRAEHLKLKSPLAIKVLEAEVATDPKAVQRFLREAQAAAALRSPNIVQIFDYGVDEEQAFIAMEMLGGEVLSERIARLGRVPPEDAFRFVGEVLRAMSKAHEAGIIHRDLKPDNVFIVKDDPEFAKVLDFGVAKVKRGALGDVTGIGTQTGMMLGTPYYMSPEQAQAKEIDPRSDLWSIAVIAYETLLGQRPFQADSLGELVIAICTSPTPVPSRTGPVPPGFDEWFVRGTQRDPARRFQSAREMAEELERVLKPAAAAGARIVTHRGIAPSPYVPTHTPSGVTTRSSGPASSPFNMKSNPGRTNPGLSTPPNDLQLTTGARSAVTRLPSEPAAKDGSGTLLAILLGAAALILIGVVVFVLGGGARAIHRAETAERGADMTVHVAAPPAAPTLPSPAPEPPVAASGAPVVASPGADPTRAPR